MPESSTVTGNIYERLAQNRSQPFEYVVRVYKGHFDLITNRYPIYTESFKTKQEAKVQLVKLLSNPTWTLLKYSQSLR